MHPKRGLIVKKKFDSAHFLEGYDGNCARIHGHTYNVEFHLNFRRMDLDELNMLLDFKVLSKVLDGVIERYDHQLLNGLSPYGRPLEGAHTADARELYVVEKNPTAEFMAQSLFYETNDAINKHFEKKCDFMEKIVVWETDKYAATFEIER
jgi:6-pyruvoyltetrahydropterin/6-carboxytetrahydropterin synthase